MIESSFLSSSPWDSDLLEDLGGQFPDDAQFDFEQFGLELDHNELFALSGSSSPLDLCSSSSDTDYMLVDDLDTILPVSDTFVSQILEDQNVTGFSDLDWLTYDTSKQYNQTQNTSTNSDGGAFNSDPFDWILGTKTWSRMTPGDQLNTLHALSDIVTLHMGLKEQMQIIRVIDPNAKITAEDKEFPLDMTNLNDAKLRKIKECIKKFRQSLQGSSHRSSLSSLETKKSNYSKIMSRKTNNVKYSRERTKRKQKKQKVIAESPEKQKRLKQTKKELKSGFFVFEKKMKLISPLEEDEDVNILE